MAQLNLLVILLIVVFLNLVVVALIIVFMIMDGNGQQANQLIFAAVMLTVMITILVPQTLVGQTIDVLIHTMMVLLAQELLIVLELIDVEEAREILGIMTLSAKAEVV
jgi:hypothetical protein